MKTNRSYLFIALSSVALVIVLIIQVTWIVQTAKIKEELFNEKANMVLSRTVEDLNADKETSRILGLCIRRNEIQKIDSLLSKNMKFYNFYIDYSFELIRPDSLTDKNETGLDNNVYKKRLDQVASQKGLELKLVFPRKEQFILAEMGMLFITSIILIIAVLILSWRTILSVLRQKKMSDYTTDFLNNMTHELKTPLTNISLAGKMILKDSNIHQEEKIRHYSGIILDENEKLRLQVEQVLSMTALERGEIPLQKNEVDFHRLIQNLLRSISVQIENKQGHVHCTLQAEKAIVFADENHLANAISNLFDNAIKYAREKPELAVQTANVGQKLQLVIADKGMGIEKKYQKQIFDKYFRVPTGDVHDVKGFGMGLAYTKTVFELHGGTISLTSEKGEGTIFTITLPYV
jgi:two-component system, OmpR family, phosphate regulon sensor histidine kinase PhoR